MLVIACFLTNSDSFSAIQQKSTLRHKNRRREERRIPRPDQKAAILSHTPLHYSMTGNANMAQTISSNPLSLSLLAGLSTCVGAAVVFFLGNRGDNHTTKPLTDAHLSASLSLAGSVMVTVTLIGILPESLNDTATLLSGVPMFLERALFVMLGLAAYVALARWVLPDEAPEYVLAAGNDEAQQMETSRKDLNSTCAKEDDPNKTRNTTKDADARRSWRMTLVLFWSLLLHNFPEGLAVAVSAVHSSRLGLTTATAIGLHNIPEGIAIAVPCLAARPNEPLLAFGLASLSGLAEPLGAYLTLVLLQQQQDDSVLRVMPDVLAFVGGIMTTVALVELFPEALKHSKEDRGPFWAGIIIGTLLMVGTEAVLDG